MYKDKFRKYNGEKIPDIIKYLKDHIKNKPTLTISVGCDSIQKRRKTTYAMTIMMYDTDIRNGAHVVFYRESHKKIRDVQQRLYKEAQYVYDIATYLDNELSDFYERKDLNEINIKKYKYHLLNCEGKYNDIDTHQEDEFINNLKITSSDKISNKLVDIHVDFNPKEGSKNEKGISQNKSYTAYKSFVPWLRNSGFRTWSKSLSYAATSAADILLK